MVSINIAYDNQALELGAYFEASKNDLVDFLAANHNDYSIHEIHSARCNEVYIEVRIGAINSQRYLFIAYSHGAEDCLISGGNSYVAVNKNTNLFTNSLFYTTACSAGHKLGEDLINNGCEAFIGYNRVVTVFSDEKQNVSIECDNCGIKMFILGRTIGDAFSLMKAYYTQQIDRLNQFGDILSASYLVANREALVFFGNPNLTIHDFA